MLAYLIKDEYPDLIPGVGYVIEKIYGDEQHMKLQGSKRRYDMKSFRIEYEGRVITKWEAHWRYRMEREMKGE